MLLFVLIFEFTFSGGISIASFELVMWSFCPPGLAWCLQLNWIKPHFEAISMVEGQDESTLSQGISQVQACLHLSKMSPLSI